MGLIDAFEREDKVEIKISTLYEMFKVTAQAELLKNAVECEVPHIFIREMMTGEKEYSPAEHIAEMLQNMLSEEEEEVEISNDSEPVKQSKPLAESLIKEMEVEVHKTEEVPAKAMIKKKPRGDIEKIQRLAAEGKSAKEIAELVGCSEPTARKYMKEAVNEQVNS